MIRMVLVLAMVAPLAAQTAITTSATRTIGVEADQVDATITAAADLTQSLEDVIAALADVGVRADTLTGISTSQGFFPGFPGLPGAPLALSYDFDVFVPLAAWKDLAVRLQALTKKAPEGLQAVRYQSQIAVSGKVVEQARQSVLADLVGEARKSAEALAAAAGFKLGGILGVTQTHSVSRNQVTVTITVRFAKG